MMFGDTSPNYAHTKHRLHALATFQLPPFGRFWPAGSGSQEPALEPITGAAASRLGSQA